VTQVALSVVLLSFAGLLAKSFTNLLDTNLGYRTHHLLTVQMPLPASRYGPTTERLKFWDTLLPQLAAVPGVISVAASDSIPLGGTFGGGSVEVEGQVGQLDRVEMSTRGAMVTPEYFRTMGIQLHQGRNFTAGDTAASEPVVIVNEEFVRKRLPGRAPIGARVRYGVRPWARIIGVIEDGRYYKPGWEAGADTYMSYAVWPHLQFVSIHTAVPEQGVLSEVRGIIRRLDPALPMTQVRSMRQSVDLSIALEHHMMMLLVGFGVATLAMATMGLSGVMLYTVSRRRREIGLRIALGARPGDISRSVLGSAARLVVAGSAIGVLAALASGRVLESQLHGVRWYDPVTLAAAPALLAVIALAACLLPSRRASTVEPMKALRQE
jgi:putative ABC transport system permease protein